MLISLIIEADVATGPAQTPIFNKPKPKAPVPDANANAKKEEPKADPTPEAEMADVNGAEQVPPLETDGGKPAADGAMDVD